jgi:hypothetical protein
MLGKREGISHILLLAVSRLGRFTLRGKFRVLVALL